MSESHVLSPAQRDLRTFWFAMVGMLPLLLAVVLYKWVVVPHQTARSPVIEPRTVSVQGAAALETLFERHGYHWPPADGVPPLLVRRLPSGMEALEVERRKALFFRTLLPLVLLENHRLRSDRKFLKEALAQPPARWRPETRDRLAELMARYRVQGDSTDPAVQERLLRRVDEVPPALALAQAANESGWGTSRFAREANNLFGVWTWDERKGLMPRARAEGATHYVRVYPDLQAAVRAYLHTLNVVEAYRTLRQRRLEMRRTGAPLDSLLLAGALERYSARGADYVAELRAMIRGNGLDRLPRLHLRPLS